MGRIYIFQRLVIASTAIFLAWSFLPYAPIEHVPEVSELLAWHGYGALIQLPYPLAPLLLGFVKVMSSIGLYFLRPWGRWLLLSLLLINVSLQPFYGLTVGAPLDSFFGSLLGLLDGAILGLAFLSPISEAMRKDV
ncbi:MAG TPA: hypothetical protein VNZ68_10775 [Rhodocyclaceae bacterium]|nr:hypothetical protein [Rhodocyclaceae bacterium]